MTANSLIAAKYIFYVFLISTVCRPTKNKFMRMENNKINLLREVLTVKNANGRYREIIIANKEIY